MQNGYRGKSYRESAQALPFNDWQSTKEQLIAQGTAIDRLEDKAFHITTVVKHEQADQTSGE